MTNEADNRGWTPLHVAASEGYVEAVRHLVTAGMDNLTYILLDNFFFQCPTLVELDFAHFPFLCPFQMIFGLKLSLTTT